MPSKKLSAVIFDFDGLILDTESPEQIVWNEIFADYGALIPSEFWKTIVGFGADQVSRTPLDLLEEQGFKFNRQQLNAHYHERAMKRIMANPILPGVLARISEARELGLAVSVCSSSEHKWVGSHLQRLGIFQLFDAITAREDAPNAKPFPDLYLCACKKAAAAPEQVMAFEDSPTGVTAAVSAGLSVIAVPNPATQGMDFSQANRVIAGLNSVTIAELAAGLDLSL